MACLTLAWGCDNNELVPDGGGELPPFALVDDASYQRLIDASLGAEILRLELSLESRPRIALASTLLMAFAERNPNAQEDQLLVYVEAVDEVLREAYPTDPELVRPAHFLPALRFSSSTVRAPELDGLDVRVGDEALSALELELSGSVRSLRVVDFERAQSINFANYTPLARLVTLLLLDQKLSGTGQAGLRNAMLSLADANGLNLRTTELEARYPEIARARARLPSDFAAFEGDASGSFAMLRALIGGELSAVRARIDTSLVAIAETLERKPDLYLASADATDPVLVGSLRERELAALRERGESRATLFLSTILIAQSEDEAQRYYARQSQDFSDAQLQTDDTLNGILSGLEVGGLVFRAASRFVSGDPLGGVSALLLTTRAVMQTVGSDAPSADEQIFDQILALRQQVETLRAEMHERFDSIDRQLNLIYEAMADGLNQIDETTRRIDANVRQVSIDLYELRSSLTGLEASLYGVLSAGFEQGFIEDMETGLDFQRRTGTSLEFVGPGENTFFAFNSRFYARATSTASDEVYAGPRESTLHNDHTAVGVLSAFPLGYNINNLRQFPQELGLPLLEFGRVANPTTWALAADAYAQLARENPWYFAKIHQNDPGRLDTLIGTGEAVRNTMWQARNRPLVEALLAQYAPRAEALHQHIGLPSYLESEGLPPGFDPFGGLDQDMRSSGPAFTEVHLTLGLGAQSREPFFDTSIAWELMDPLGGLAAAARLEAWEPSTWKLAYRNFFNPSGGERAYHMRVQLGRRPPCASPGCPERNGSASRWGIADVFYEFVDEVPSFPVEWVNNNSGLVGRILRASEGDEIMAEGVALVVTRRTAVPRPFDDAMLPSEEEVLEAMAAVGEDYWDTADEVLSSSTTRELLASLTATQALLTAYVALGMPETIDENDLVHAILRGTPGEPGHLSGEWILSEFAAAQAAGQGPPLFVERLVQRAALLLDALAPSLDSEAHQSHPYLEWSIASLQDLRRHANSPAVSDTYVASRNATLAISVEDGVLSNDAQARQFSAITAFVEEGPQNGTVAMAEDGSFAYSPSPGFSGRDGFTYRATANLADAVTGENTVTTDPVPVVVWVR